MSIKPDDVEVREIYTDLVANRTTTDVYANGKMQACVFPVVTYVGSSKVTTEALKKYAQKNVQIYRILHSGEKAPLDPKWQYSSTSNGYKHDINHSYASKDTELQYKSLRVPFYFTVPLDSSGSYRWVAKHNNRFSPDKAFVTVTCHTFSVQDENFDFIEIAEVKHYYLRTLRYANLPPSLKLIRCKEYQGEEIKAGGTVGVCWRAYYGAFFEKFNLLGHKSSSLPTRRGLSPQYVELANVFTSQQINTAWAQGVAVIAFYFPKFPTFSMDKLKLEDNFGNSTSVDLAQWSIKNAIVIVS